MLNQAAAWRAKYREMKSNALLKVRVENFGVHPCNRAGCYPSGLRCKELLQDVLTNGFLKEEYATQLVAVEEMPTHEAVKLRGGPQSRLTGSEYNRQESRKDSILKGLFEEPFGTVNYSLLSHNHMSMGLLAFVTKAKWNLQPIEQKKLDRTIHFCDESGHMSLTAVAATVNGKELAEVVQEGVLCEVLSWKMEVEEPDAASVISNALNKFSETAMKTTEWSALYTLRAHIIKAAGDLGERVAFKTILQRAHLELDSAADDPDLDKLFDFLLGLGVTVNTYWDEFADFQKAFINSKQRKLRFAAFGVVNKLDDALPRSKVAIIKRAYRKKSGDPKNVWCSSPENTWTAVAASAMQSLEELLRYVHESEEIQKKIDPDNPARNSPKRTGWYGNVDIALADKLMATYVQSRGKANLGEIRSALLKAVSTYMIELKFDKDNPPPAAAQKSDWITTVDLLDQTAVAAGNPQGTPTSLEETQAKVEVLKFDQKTGAMLNKQVEFTVADGTGKAAPIQLPWKSWHEEQQNMALDDADKAAVVTTLENIHRLWDISGVNVAILLNESNKTSVTAVAAMQPKALMLPPCVPKQRKVYDVTNEHPMALQVSVSLALKNGDDPCGQAVDKGTPPSRMCHWLLCPEFKAPTLAPTAVAADAGGELDEPEWIYSRDQSESLHPFWAVRRLTDIELQKEKDEVRDKMKKTGASLRMPEFNCELVSHTHTVCHIASFDGQNMSSTRFISLPCISNVRALEAGEELILRHVPRAKVKKEKKRTWQDEQRDLDRNAAKKPKIGKL